ncbi:MAG: hypothetical protein IT379_14580 [Deltaproteobacteria bacterium]|nr:hypothetical protein [Deltaproteobacteria bacterium]
MCPRPLHVVITTGALALAGCSLVLDPSDYVGDADAGETPPPPVAPPPGACDPLSSEAPPWRGCPFVQQGPASFDVPLATGELALAVVPGGDTVRGFGAIGFVEADDDVTIGTFAIEDIDLSNPFELDDMVPILGARTLALRGLDENFVAINLVSGSMIDESVRGWIGRVSADDVFELTELYDQGSELLARAGITGGFVPSPALQVFPLRHVWRARDGMGDRLYSADESGGSQSIVASLTGPTGDRVEVSDTSGQWIALSTDEQVQLWRTDVEGEPQTWPTEDRTGRAAIAASPSGCHYALVYPRTTGLALVPLRCDRSCSELEMNGAESVIATEGQPSLPSIAPMADGGWALAAAEARDGANPVVVVRLLANDLSVLATLDPLTPTGFGDLVAPGYLDVRIAVAQRMSTHHVVVAASHDQGESGAATPHWVAAFRGCGG